MSTILTCEPDECESVSCRRVQLREFRYDSGRRRYLYRERHPDTLATTATEWTDYDGDAPWLNYTLSGAAATAVNEYVAGIAQRIVGESGNVYFHGDQALDMQIGATDQTPFQVAAGLKERARQGQVGSTRMVSDAAGLPARRVVYTAFGEPIYSEPPAQAGGLTRYLYAGAWGYENFNDPGFPFLHVGERWYDPATGRFLQRDPIGIAGGLNVYVYLGNNPVPAVDPSGLDTWSDTIRRIGGIAVGAIGIGVAIDAWTRYHYDSARTALEKAADTIGCISHVRLDIAEKNPRLSCWQRVNLPPGGLVHSNGRLTNLVYIGLNDGRVSVVATIDGQVVQRYYEIDWAGSGGNPHRRY